jgi:high affinity sulfate transporter 1
LTDDDAVTDESASPRSGLEPKGARPRRLTPAVVASGLASWLPGLQVARHYERSWLAKDIVAGIVLSALLVPAGMGYATAAGLPPITGLYATIFPLLAYALVGPSRILVLGPDSSLAPLIAAAILPLAAAGSAEAVGLAGVLALMTGALCIGAGLARLGFLTDLLSKPVRYGYMNGIALTVLVSQIPKLLGFSIDAEGLIPEITGTVRGIVAGETVPAAALIGGACLVIILGCRQWAPKVPGVLIAVIGATMAVSVLGLEDVLPVVGAVPQGLPTPSLPPLEPGDVTSLLAAAIGIAFVSFADTSVLSRTYAARGGYVVDPNRELVALGVANTTGALFQGFSVSSSASRTPVAEAAGSKTQLTGVVGAGIIVLLLVFVPALLADLPTTALAAVVISAALVLFEVTGVRRLYDMRRSEFLLSMAAFLAVAFFGVIAGIGIAIGLSLLDFIRRAWRPHDAVLGRVDGLKGYHDVTSHPNVHRIPGLILFRWDAPLFFANADLFRERVREVALEADPPARWVVVAAEPITDVDTTAADMIEELSLELEAAGIELAFAEMKTPVKEWLRRYELEAKIGRELFFSTTGAAVKRYLATHDVDWLDWEDAAQAADPHPADVTEQGDRPAG